MRFIYILYTEYFDVSVVLYMSLEIPRELDRAMPPGPPGPHLIYVCMRIPTKRLSLSSATAVAQGGVTICWSGRPGHLYDDSIVEVDSQCHLCLR